MWRGSLQRKSAGLYFAHFVVRRMKFASQVVRTVKHTSFKPQNLRHHLGLQAPLITDIFCAPCSPLSLDVTLLTHFRHLYPSSTEQGTAPFAQYRSPLISIMQIKRLPKGDALYASPLRFFNQHLHVSH